MLGCFEREDMEDLQILINDSGFIFVIISTVTVVDKYFIYLNKEPLVVPWHFWSFDNSGTGYWAGNARSS